MLELSKNSALIIIDLQEGVLNPEPIPFGKAQVVERSVALAQAFAAVGKPIVLTVTDFARGYADAPKGIADTPWDLPGGGLPADFARLVSEVDTLPAVARIIKRQMSAFFGTELDLQLRRRGCDTVAICGVATNMGVEATARAAFDLNYNVVIAQDACSSIAPGLHEFAVERILPRISRVRQTDEIIQAVCAS